MNCKESHLLIAGLTGDDLPGPLAAHVRSCPACADRLAVDARLRATLRSHPLVAPPDVLLRLRSEVAAPRRRSWTESLRKNPTMKITLSAATAIALATALVTLPRAADATTPVATFAKMRRAVLAKAKSMTSLDVRVGKTPDGSVGTWVVLDGELTQLGPNGSFHQNKDGKDITVTTSMTSQGGDHAGKTDTVTTSTDLSSLPPEQRAHVRKAIADAMAGKGGSSVTTTYTVNGQAVDGETAHRMLHEHGLDLSLRIDLDADDYGAIAFGADHDHLVLTPKASRDWRTVVTLDPRSSLPRSVLVERLQNGRWIASGRSEVRLG